MRVPALLGAVCLIALSLTHTIGFGSLGVGLVETARAQTVPKSLEEGGSDAAMKLRRNSWTVGVAGGQLSGTYMTFANELAEVLDDGDNLRVLPIVTYGAASNLEDLKGKKVSFGPAGSASSLTGTIVFQRLGIQVEQVLYDNPTALQKLKTGELAALVRVIGKPVDFFAKIPANSGLHFVPIPFSKTFADYYTVGELTRREYPSLVSEGERVDTIATPAVLAVFNWSKGNDRYRRIERFVEGLFTKWDKFREPPRHPKWRDVNLAATVPGWTRWSVAEEILRRIRPKDAVDPQVASSDFSAYLKDKGSAAANFTQEQRETLFREFLQWQEKKRNSAQR